MTICVNCIHFLQDEKKIWYNQFCKAKELSKGINPVNGKEEHIITNDLGNKNFTSTKYDFCRNVNLGNCELFIEKK